MKIGKRIRFFRELRGMTQKELGIEVGFSEKSADVRIAQYESDRRKPKHNTLVRIAYELRVPVIAITLDEEDGCNMAVDSAFMMLFFLDDLNVLHPKLIDGQVVFVVNNDLMTLDKWARRYMLMENGWISKEEYMDFKYPEGSKR